MTLIGGKVNNFSPLGVLNNAKYFFSAILMVFVTEFEQIAPENVETQFLCQKISIFTLVLSKKLSFDAPAILSKFLKMRGKRLGGSDFFF